MNENERCLTVQEILARSWQEGKARFAPLFLLAGAGPAFNWLIMGLTFGFNPLFQSEARQQQPLLFVLLSLISTLAGLVFMAALILFICKRAATPLQACQQGLLRLPRMLGGVLGLGAAMLALALVLGALPFGALYLADASRTAYVIALIMAAPVLMICLMVAGVYLVLWFYPLVLTDIPITATLRLSFNLVKGKFWNTLGLLFILGLINAAVAVLTAVAVVTFSIMFALALPAMTGALTFLWVPAGALSALIFQLPLIALYLDRVAGVEHTPLVSDNPSLEGRQP